MEALHVCAHTSQTSEWGVYRDRLGCMCLLTCKWMYTCILSLNNLTFCIIALVCFGLDSAAITRQKFEAPHPPLAEILEGGEDYVCRSIPLHT